MSSGAKEKFQEGMELYRRYRQDENAKARALFQEARRLDPGFAKAYAGLADTHRQDWLLGWAQDPDASKELAYRKAKKAVEVARREPEPKPSLPYALERLAYVLLYQKQCQEASDAAREAVQRNPNYADGYAVWAHALIYWGKPTEALEKTQEAIDRNPNSPQYPFFYDYHLGQAYYVWGFQTEKTNPNASRRYYQKAEEHLWVALRKNANFRPARSYLVAVLYKLMRIQDAVDQMRELQRRGRPPTSKDYVERVAPYENPAITEELLTIWTQVERLTRSRVVAYVQEKGLQGLSGVLTDLIRRHPVSALLIGLGIGFVLGRNVGPRPTTPGS